MARYIDAEGLNLYDDLFMSKDTINKSGVYVRYRAVENLIKNAPTADVQEVKHGKWIKDVSKRRGDGEIYDYICNICGTPAIESEYGNCDIFQHYCPNCGAKMDGKEN